MGSPRTVVVLLVALAGCGHDQAVKAEAGRVSVAIDALVAAGPHAKAPALATLEATPCAAAEVCAARQACLDAFRPQVAAADRQREARAMLDRHDPALASQIDAKLDEAERLQVEARKLQEGCLSSATAMRQAHRL